MNGERFALLMESLSKQMELEGEPIKESPVDLPFGDFDITLATDERSFAEELLMYAVVGVVPEEKELELYRILLEANLLWNATGDATLGVNSASREVTLAYRVPADGLDAEKLANLLGCFYQVAKDWHDFLKAAAEGDEGQPPAPAVNTSAIRA